MNIFNLTCEEMTNMDIDTLNLAITECNHKYDELECARRVAQHKMEEIEALQDFLEILKRRNK